MKLSKSIIICFLVLLVNISAAIGARRGKEGHGGYGVLDKNGKPQLMDLVEASTEKNPYFNMEIRLNQQLKNDLSLSLYNLQLTTHELNLLVRKLTEIENASPVLAFTYLAAIKLYTWKLVNYELIHLPDLSTVLRVKNQNLVLLANRKEQYIRISENYWNQMDSAHKVALIFHEITYAFIPQVYSSEEEEDYASDEEYIEDLVAQSAKARDITGYLFSIDFKLRGLNGFNVINNSTIPFNFTSEKVNIFNHTWNHAPAGFNLRRGKLVIELKTNYMINAYYNYFVVDFSSGDSILPHVKSKIKNYCNQLKQNSRFPNIEVELHSDSLKNIAVRFAEGRVDSHLVIEESNPVKEIRIISKERFIEADCENILLKEIYFKNRFYTPIDRFSDAM